MNLERIEARLRNVDTVVREAGGPVEHWIKTDELRFLLNAARALARLSEWLRDGHRRMETITNKLTEQSAVTLFSPGRHAVSDVTGPDLASAIHAALDEAEARK